MSREKFQDEIDKGAAFWGYEETGTLTGVMGLQQVQDVTLIRHTYSAPVARSEGLSALAVSFAGTGKWSSVGRHMG